MMETVKIGFLTPLYWVIGIILTGASGFLGMVEFEVLAIPFLVFFIGGILLVLVTGRVGLVQEDNRLGIRVIASICIALGLLALETWFLYEMFNIGFQATPGGVMTGILFAIYEETLFLGVAAALALAGTPDLFAAIFQVFVFVPLHALAYASTILIDLTLALARLTLSGSLYMADNSDVPYSVHILWNVLVNLQ